MKRILYLLFSLWVLPAFGNSVVTVTPVILDGPTVIDSSGLKRVKALLILAGTYVTGGVPILASHFGLTRFKPTVPGSGVNDPVVTQFNNGSSPAAMNAIITSGNLRLVYPTGGATAAPATPAAPIVTAGATPVTSTAATGALTPGVAKELPNTGDVSNFSVVAVAEGY